MSTGTAPQYSMLIQWSDRDGAYLVTLPEWEAAYFHGGAHGSTYAEAAAAGQELIDSWLDYVQHQGVLPPAPRLAGR